MNTLGNRLKILRGHCSGKKFAEFLGVKAQTLYRYEQGLRTPGADFIILIAEKTNSDIAWILTGEVKTPKTALEEDFPSCNPEYTGLLEKILKEERKEKLEITKQNIILTEENKVLWQENKNLWKELGSRKST